MNKSDLISTMAQSAGLSKPDARKALEAFVDSVFDTLKTGDKVTMIGFGTFSTTVRPARKGRNPRNPSEVIDIPERRVVKFTPGGELKKAVLK